MKLNKLEKSLLALLYVASAVSVIWLSIALHRVWINRIVEHPEVPKVDLQQIAKQAMWERMQAVIDDQTVQIYKLEGERDALRSQVDALTTLLEQGKLPAVKR